MKKKILLSFLVLLILLALSSCGDLQESWKNITNQGKLNRAASEEAAVKNDSTVKAIELDKNRSEVQYLTRVNSLYMNIDVYKIKVDSSEYLVVIGPRSVAMIKHK